METFGIEASSCLHVGRCFKVNYACFGYHIKYISPTELLFI